MNNCNAVSTNILLQKIDFLINTQSTFQRMFPETFMTIIIIKLLGQRTEREEKKTQASYKMFNNEFSVLTLFS